MLCVVYTLSSRMTKRLLTQCAIGGPFVIGVSVPEYGLGSALIIAPCSPSIPACSAERKQCRQPFSVELQHSGRDHRSKM
eukprot:6099987-Amphidinium_carterae.2